MGSSSMRASLGTAFNGSDMTNAECDAMNPAADACTRRTDGPVVEPLNGQVTGRPQFPAASPAANARAGRQTSFSGFGMLPDGFVPLREARSMALLGRWPTLDDRTPTCLPMKVLLVMQRRCENGDHGAETWLKIYARAYAGEAEAQRAFGRVCENGAFRAPADLQRAFFWYYRAALQGDLEARKDAERLRLSTRISPATMAEPMLVYPGPWRITVDMFGEVTSANLFEFAESGAISGYLIGSDGALGGMTSNGSSTLDDPYTRSLLSSVRQDVQYNGRWAYDNARKIVTMGFTGTAAGMPASQSEAWQIELLGCRKGALFGRDRRMVSYTLEYMGPAGEALPLKRGSAGNL